MTTSNARPTDTELEADVLALLPIAPDAAALADLADGILGRRDPVALGRVRRALDRIAGRLGRLHRTRVDCPDLGLYDVPGWGLRRRDRSRAHRLADRLAAADA